MNNHKIMTILMLFVMTTLAGCFQVERVVTVKPDGSATLEETFMMSKKALKAMSEAFGDKESGKLPDDFGMEDKEKLKAAAAGMGEGVSFVRSEKISNEQFAGYKAVYSVADINKLQISSAPPKVDGKQEATDPSKSSRFVFTPGDPATLRIISPNSPAKAKVAEKAEPSDKAPAKAPETKPETKPETEPKQPQPGKQEMEMLKQLFDGMRFALSVKVDGKIVETNATHRENSTVILADLDFGKLLSVAPEELSKLNNMKDGDMLQAMEMLKNFPGVKVDMNEEVRIRFR